jgi:hypothetical protein
MNFVFNLIKNNTNMKPKTTDMGQHLSPSVRVERILRICEISCKIDKFSTKVK